MGFPDALSNRVCPNVHPVAPHSWSVQLVIQKTFERCDLFSPDPIMNFQLVRHFHRPPLSNHYSSLVSHGYPGHLNL